MKAIGIWLRNIFLTASVLLVLAVFFESLLFRIFFTVVLENLLGVPVSIQSVHFDPLNTQFFLKNIQFENPEKFPKSPLARLEEVLIDFEISSLREKRIHIETLKINCREVHILRNSEGSFNWFYLKVFRRDETANLYRPRPPSWLVALHRWPLRIDQYQLILGRAVYTNYMAAVPVRRSFGLEPKDNRYEAVSTLEDVVKILAWVTLLGLKSPELEDTLNLLFREIEPKLGTSHDFLARWRDKPASNGQAD